MKNNVLKFKRKENKMPLPDIPSDLIKIADFASKYDCSKSYIYKLTHSGKLRIFKIGNFKISEAETLKALGV